MGETCKTCGHKLVALFYTMSCERCENPMSGWFYHGYILWTQVRDELWEIQEHPIFKKMDDIEVWWDKQYNPDNFTVRDVLAYDPFLWTTMYGTSLEIADRYHWVRNDHLFDPKTSRPTVILMPEDVALPDQESLLLDKQSRVSLGLKW